MRLQRLAVLQWVGLLLGAITWTTAHLAGIGITQAECNATGLTKWGLSNPAWQGTVMGVSAAFIVAAEICAVTVFWRTRGIEFGDGPPVEGFEGERKPTRIHFFSAASVAANAIFLMIVLLDGFANLFDIACRQS
jgi:hypothetical protein